MTGMDEYSRLYGIFEAKLERISEEVGYKEEAVGTEAYNNFELAWTSYLGELGIFRNLASGRQAHFWQKDSAKTQYYSQAITERSVLIGDPLYTSGKWLEVPSDLCLRILALGTLP
jgi:hypothetical protein